MTRDEAVQKLATVGHLSMAHAEDLYDSFFPKPVVPQYVADWYEGNKDEFECELFLRINTVLLDFNIELDGFDEWLSDATNNPIQTLVNMHQFGYEVKKEKRYRVSMPKTRNHKDHAQLLCEADGKVFLCGEWYKFRTKFTREELEENGFGWVFDCEGVEIEEVE